MISRRCSCHLVFVKGLGWRKIRYASALARDVQTVHLVFVGCVMCCTLFVTVMPVVSLAAPIGLYRFLAQSIFCFAPFRPLPLAAR